MPTDIPLGVTPTYTQQYRRCGKPGCPLCVAGGRGHGPYWYAYWREAGRTRSRYLGKQPPAGVAPPPAPVAGPETSVVVPAAPSRRPGAAQHGAAPGAAPALRVRTLGGFALWRGEQSLTGPGGAGKTRLALQLADDLLDGPDAYPDGVWLVELASLADPLLVPRAVGVQEEAARPLAESLAALHALPSVRLLQRYQLAVRRGRSQHLSGSHGSTVRSCGPTHRSRPLHDF